MYNVQNIIGLKDEKGSNANDETISTNTLILEKMGIAFF